MRWLKYSISMVFLAAFMAGCAGPSARDDDAAGRRAEQKREQQREQERMCRIAEAQGRRDPNCPQGERRPSEGGLGVPEVPPVAVPK